MVYVLDLCAKHTGLVAGRTLADQPASAQLVSVLVFWGACSEVTLTKPFPSWVVCIGGLGTVDGGHSSRGVKLRSSQVAAAIAGSIFEML